LILQNSQDRSIIPRESIDKLVQRLRTASPHKKVVIIQNIHLIHPHVVGMFLKLLEDPPENTLFILLTSDERMLRRSAMAALLSRTLHVSFNELKPEAIQSVLSDKWALKSLPDPLPSDLKNLREFGRTALSQAEHLGFLLAVFDRKRYNTGELLRESKTKSVSLSDAVSYLRMQLLTAMDATAARKVNRLLDDAERLSAQSVNMSDEKLLGRLFFSIKAF
jgi:DNA polymerase III, delta subunit